MTRLSPTRVIAAARRGLQKIVDDVRGVAAVEFGIIAPVLLVMLIGVIEITRAVSIDRRFGQVTSMVADLVAREENMTEDDLNAIYGIVEHVMGVWGTESLGMEVLPIQAHPTNASIRRIYAQTTNRPNFGSEGVTRRPYCQDYTNLSEDLLSPGTSVIVVESKFSYSPLLVGGILSAQEWKDKAILAPRNSCVDFDDNNCVSTCF